MNCPRLICSSLTCKNHTLGDRAAAAGIGLGTSGTPVPRRCTMYRFRPFVARGTEKELPAQFHVVGLATRTAVYRRRTIRPDAAAFAFEKTLSLFCLT